jgi:hypothetical protein
MPMRAVVDSSRLREAARQVKDIDPTIRKNFIRDLKADLKPYANAITAQIPGKGSPPLSGFGRGLQHRWTGARNSIHVTPGGGRGSLARIEIYGPGEGKGAFKLIDRAGTSSYTNTTQGEAMNKNLEDLFPLSANGKGGRFAWKGFMANRPAFVKQVIARLDQYADEISRGIG